MRGFASPFRSFPSPADPCACLCLHRVARSESRVNRPFTEGRRRKRGGRCGVSRVASREKRDSTQVSKIHALLSPRLRGDERRVDTPIEPRRLPGICVSMDCRGPSSPRPSLKNGPSDYIPLNPRAIQPTSKPVMSRIRGGPATRTSTI